MKIKVGFSRHKGFAPIGWAIMAAERTKFSHAFIEIRSDSLDRNLIYHATGSGVYFIGETNFLDQNEVVESFEFEISDEGKKRLLQWAIDQSGKPYGKLQLIGIGIMRTARLFGVTIRNPFQNEGSRYICTELVARALYEAGLVKVCVDYDSWGLKECRNQVSALLAA